MGLPGSGKTTLSDKIANLLNASRVNADWDFSAKGRIRQANRMNDITKKKLKKNHVVADFICPTVELRKKFKADYIIWMNTITKGRYEDTNNIFEIPEKYEFNYEVKEKNADNIKLEIVNDIKSIFKI